MAVSVAVSLYVSHVQTQLLRCCWALPCPFLCLVLLHTSSLNSPVGCQGTRVDERLMCLGTVFESGVYSWLVKTVDSPSLLKSTGSEMGVTQVPMACCLNTELYYTAISHPVILREPVACLRFKVFCLSALWSTCIRGESPARYLFQVLETRDKCVTFFKPRNYNKGLTWATLRIKKTVISTIQW